MDNTELTNTVHQHTNEITMLTRKINEFDADLKIITRDQVKLSQVIESQIKTTFEIIHIKENIKETNANITLINTTLKNIETNLLKNDAEAKATSTLRNDLKKYLPALIVLCIAMFILGLVFDDMNIVKLIFGRTP